ncbi:glycosyltransferase [Rhizorhabdus histidinilytica]
MHADPLAAYAYRWFGPIAERATIDRHFQWFWNHLRRNARRFDRVICANHGFAARLSAGGVAHVATVPLGIDAGIFSPVHRDEALRADLLARCGLGPDARLLLGIGRHSPEKRWPMVIDACQRASLKRPIGLVLVGGGRDSARIRRHIGGNPHVHLLAPVRDRMLLARLMASADALIHGCEAETYGLAAAEAAASGLPLIVPAEGGRRSAPGRPGRAIPAGEQPVGRRRDRSVVRPRHRRPPRRDPCRRRADRHDRRSFRSADRRLYGAVDDGPDRRLRGTAMRHPPTPFAQATHIAIVMHDFSNGGTERIAIRLANRWARTGRRVSILCGTAEGPARALVDPGSR